MLSLALGWAEVLGAADIFIGVNAVDYSGYPDCRPEFIAAFEQLAKLATAPASRARRLRVHAPLMHCRARRTSSARACAWAWTTALTVSCYQADADGPRLRPLRFLPPAPRGLRVRRRARPDPLPAGS